VREDRRVCQEEIATISKLASLVYCGDNEEEDDEDEEDEEKKHGEEEEDEEDDGEEEPVWAACGRADSDGDV
jgi:hypothetical protein